MIEVRYKARLGNNLFQYCLGRILAEELGFALQAEPIPGFTNTGQRVEGTVCQEPEQVLTGQRIPLDGILADRSPRRIILDGWFQRHEYYRPHRHKILEWLAFDSSIRVLDVIAGPVVYVRRTDYVQLGWALPFSYYEEAIERSLPTGGEVWIVTDDTTDPFFRRFKRWHPKFFRGSALETMLFMARARRLIMSQSTFCWWPAFLGNAEGVLCPLPSFGIWSENVEGDKVELIDRDHFECIACDVPDKATPAERRHQKIRAWKRDMVLRLNRWLKLTLPVPPP